MCVCVCVCVLGLYRSGCFKLLDVYLLSMDSNYESHCIYLLLGPHPAAAEPPHNSVSATHQSFLTKQTTKNRELHAFFQFLSLFCNQ